MKKVESTSAWSKDGDWKARYSKLYSSRHASVAQSKEEPCRISFMGNDVNSISSATTLNGPLPSCMNSLLSQRSDTYRSFPVSIHSDDLGGHETKLLDMVRAQNREALVAAQNESLELPEEFDSDDQSIDACIHGLSMRNTERSISRSRVSRISTRRDMDIPAILAFNAGIAGAAAPADLPAFPKGRLTSLDNIEEKPRWSIRRSMCPVCSQKWRDRSSINIVKNSGLKRNSSSDLPSIIAPARLRTSIALEYTPRPVLSAVDEESTVTRTRMRNTGTSWQLIRARRFRVPKLIMPPPEATAPPGVTAPLAIKDLDTRVNRFLAS